MRFYQIGHYGPIGAICFILWITITAWNCLVQWYPPNVDDLFSLINAGVFWLWFAMIFYKFFRTIFIGPGFVPKNWQPKRKEDEKYLEYCKICSNFKVPRSHHCRTCHRCVLKLDHHCPWMNICIGYYNQIDFCCFLIYSILGCIHALLMICPCIYRILFIPYHPYTWQRNGPRFHFTWFSFLASILSIGLAIGVIIAVGFLLIIQLRNMLYNQTTIEYWIVRRAYGRNPSFIYPYDLGFKQNCLQLFKSIDRENFIWPVRANCHPYTLTCEQLEQKFEMNQRTVRYRIIHDYSGSFKFDIRACFKRPRLSVKEGESIFVTHWETNWIYGRYRTSSGWLPRSCIDETFDINQLWFSSSKMN